MNRWPVPGVARLSAGAPTLRGMTDVTIFHNPRCSTSRAALAAADEGGVDVEVIEYLKRPLSEAELRDLIGKLEDAPTDLVRRDAAFADQVVAVLLEHPKLLQRPVLVRGDRAIIGRPKDRVPTFLA